MDKHGVKKATVRHGLDFLDEECWDIECRFENGEKYVAIKVCFDKPELAHWIAKALSADISYEQLERICKDLAKGLNAYKQAVAEVDITEILEDEYGYKHPVMANDWINNRVEKILHG